MAPQTVWTVFAATVARFGRRVAIEVQRPDRVDRFTYQELHDLAVAHGTWLANNGVQPGDRCAILAHNDAHWCAVYLGILRAGATAVPLDTNYSAKQAATIVGSTPQEFQRQINSEVERWRALVQKTGFKFEGG